MSVLFLAISSPGVIILTKYVKELPSEMTISSYKKEKKEKRKGTTYMRFQIHGKHLLYYQVASLNFSSIIHCNNNKKITKLIGENNIKN